MTADADAGQAVEAAARAARDTVADLASVPDELLDDALRTMADQLVRRADPVLEANEADIRAAQADGIRDALLDRLRLDQTRIEAIAGQLRALAGVPAEPAQRTIRELPGGLRLTERRRPVGVIGANFEARPNVVVDIASQFVKSRNAGVLRTGSAAIRSAIALADEVIAPALRATKLDPAMIQLVRVPGQDSARALVSKPGLIPLVILRGSGDSTRALAAEAASHGVRTMAHADGGAVMYLDAAADPAMAEQLVRASLDRLGVCNRLNLLLVHRSRWEELVPPVTALLDRLGIAAALPPHAHPLGHEWALLAGWTLTSPPMPKFFQSIASPPKPRKKPLRLGVPAHVPPVAAIVEPTGVHWPFVPGRVLSMPLELALSCAVPKPSIKSTELCALANGTQSNRSERMGR